jgi:ABC-2 type transport system ATP-binding protein
MPSQQQPAIDLRGLRKVYGRGEHALTAVDGVTLQVPRGQVFAFLGPNGAGKTTTIKMTSGLLTPTAGEVWIGGFHLRRQRAHAVLQLGAVLEGSRNVYWPLTAWQNLLYFGRLKGLGAREIRPRAERLLSELGLWERRHEAVGGFSRGMQQKVAIAAALITDPPVLLLDEPTIGLDVEAARTVRGWVRRLAREEGKTVVLTTHQLEIVQELADRVAVIRQGSIIADLPTPELVGRFREDRFQIQVAAPADGLAAALPAGARTEATEEGTRIVLPGAGQTGLYQVLADVQRRRLPLVSVAQVQPSMEDIFLRLLNEDERS